MLQEVQGHSTKRSNEEIPFLDILFLKNTLDGKNHHSIGIILSSALRNYNYCTLSLDSIRSHMIFSRLGAGTAVLRIFTYTYPYVCTLYVMYKRMKGN